MNTERPQPYVGISGVVESGSDEPHMQDWLMDQFVWQELEREDDPRSHQLALGVKAVHKTQYLDIENKYGREWYPVGEAEFVKALDDDGMKALRVAQIYLTSTTSMTQPTATSSCGGFVDVGGCGLMPCSLICCRGTTTTPCFPFSKPSKPTRVMRFCYRRMAKR